MCVCVCVCVCVVADASLAHLDTLCESWMDLAVRTFGKEEWWNRIKFHAHRHLRRMVELHGDVPHTDESQVRSFR